MLNFLNHLLSLLGDNPSLTPWILLIIMFVLIALASGRAGKMALRNVDTLMQQGEEQRKRLEKEIERKDRIIAARDKYIDELEDDQKTTIEFVTGLRRDMAELQDKVFNLERINRGLLEDHQRALEMLEDKKDGH